MAADWLYAVTRRSGSAWRAAAVNAIAYRQDTAESDRGHPLNALNATTRARLQTYELAVAEVG